MTLIKQVNEFGEIKPDKLYLIIFHADKKPPHLGLIWNKLYFSLTIKGSEIEIPFDEKLELINKRSIPCLFLEIKTADKSSFLLKELTEIFSSYPPLTNKTSCLEPIGEFFYKIFQLKAEAPLLHGMIDALQKQQLIIESFSLHLKRTDNKTFELPPYDAGEVSERIRRLILLEQNRTS
jgi:hypothetical protein